MFRKAAGIFGDVQKGSSDTQSVYLQYRYCCSRDVTANVFINDTAVNQFNNENASNISSNRINVTITPTVALQLTDSSKNTRRNKDD